MIQRIQSVYLLLTTILSVLFLSGNIITFNNSDGLSSRVIISGIYMTSAGVESKIGHSLLLVVPVMLSGFISLIAIFMFKRRTFQLWFVRMALSFIIIAHLGGAYYILDISRKYDVNFEMGFRILLPLLIFALIMFALRGIIHDEKLVRSYDRLR